MIKNSAAAIIRISLVYFAFFLDGGPLGIFTCIVIAECLAIQLETYNAKKTTKKRSLTPADLIKLAQGAYKHLDEPLSLKNGWVRVQRYAQRGATGTCTTNDKSTDKNSRLLTGASIDIYENKRDQFLVLALRGTDPSFLGNLQQDAKLFADRLEDFVTNDEIRYLPEYATFLLATMMEWETRRPSYQLYLTGHSLGAACCEAAWAADLARKTSEAEGRIQTTATTEGSPLRLWKCTTWESPGFSVNGEMRQLLNAHRHLLDSHVVHYLGAPNVINCLHPHISERRRYRVFLEHDNHLSIWYIVGCVWHDATVVFNWMSSARVGCKLGANLICNFREAAEMAEAASGQSPVVTAQTGWAFIHQKWVEVTCQFSSRYSNNGVTDTLQLLEKTMSMQSDRIGYAQTYINQFFGGSMPMGDALTWSVIRGNAAVEGAAALDYVLRQHCLKNHINSFDVRSGYPLRWVQMESWPSMSSMTVRTVTEMARSAFIPRSLTEHLNPSAHLENKLQRIEGYKEGPVYTADSAVLRDHYNYLGAGFFQEIISLNLHDMERTCREEYKRIAQSRYLAMPTPVFIVD